MAGTASVSGLISGMETDTIISKIMEVAQKPVTRLQNTKAAAQSREAAWLDINTRMLALKTKTDTLASSATFQTKQVTSSDSTMVTATAYPAAATGTYEFKITSRAMAHQLISAETYDSTNSLVGTGNLTITKANGGTISVDLDENNNTLTGLKDKINAANGGVKASIVNTGSTTAPKYTLMLISTETGVDNKINSITSGFTGGTAPTFDLDNPVQAASDAIIKLGSGAGEVTINKSSNNISDVIPGVTLNILSYDATKTVRVEVSQNTATATDAVKGFVTQYNDLMSAINTQFKYNSTTKESGVLMSDVQLQQLQREISSMVTTSVAGANPGFTTLSSVGVSMGTDGQLTLDSTKLSSAITDHSDDVAKLFSPSFVSDSTYVSMVTNTSSTEASLGAGWSLSVTQAASRTNLRAGVAMNNPLGADEKLNINGKDVSLTAGMTMSQVMTAINAKSNDTGVGAYEVVDGTDHYLALRSNQYGSAYEVSVYSSLSSTGVNTTGIGNLLSSSTSPAGESGTGVGEKGLDVQGTIFDGSASIACTGSGQVLTANPDSSTKTRVKGLSLLVQYATVPTTNTNIKFTKGIGTTLRDMLTSSTSTTGVVTTRQNAIQDEIDDIDVRITDFNAKLTAQQEKLYTQFSRMESQLASLQQQGNSLSSLFTGSTSSSK